MMHEAGELSGLDGDNKDNGKGQPPKVHITKKGILSKKSRSKLFSVPWALRTIILDSENKLYYYDGKVLKGEIILAGTVIDHIAHQDMADGRSFAFQINNIMSVKRTQTTSLTLAAGSYQEADDWVTCLTKASAGSTSTGAAGYITFEVRNTGILILSANI